MNPTEEAAASTSVGRADLSTFSNRWYDPGASAWKRVAWYVVHALFFASWFPLNGVKVLLLRLFGAQVGHGVVVKPRVTIKYPWRLSVGDHVWIGELAWIDNLVAVSIGDHVCISQGALLLTGNHNYKSTGFDLVVGEIRIEDGVWIGARSIVCPGVTCGTHAVLSAGSVANRDLAGYTIYQGSPARAVRERVIS